jgi:hypothetical protein
MNRLSFYAGEKALALIRDAGLSPEMVEVMAGAAGGPKWLVLYGLDRYLFSDWLADRKAPLHLLGSSIGAFRFAAAMAGPPAETIDRLREAYIHQAYTGKPSPLEVSEKSRAILDVCLADGGADRVLAHPFLRLNVLATRCRGLSAREPKAVQMLGLSAAALSNLAGRRHLARYFERALFHDPRAEAPFHGMADFPTVRLPLTRENLAPAVMASGSIPLVMAGVPGLSGSGDGMYRDGGMIDYHLDVPYNVDRGLVLFPHYTDRIIPGWLDKHLPWRKPHREHLERLLLVCPSRAFIQHLPYAKIPDRNDFYTFKGNDPARFAFWNTVADRSRLLADDFAEAVATGEIRGRVRPIGELMGSGARKQ